MSQSWSTCGNQSSPPGSEEPEVRPFVRRADDDILAILQGHPALNAASLAKNSTPIADHCRRTQRSEKMRKVDAEAQLIMLELPSKTKHQLTESFSEFGPMEYFLMGTEGGVGYSIDDGSRNAIVMRNALSADIDAEMQRTKEAPKGRAGQKK